jgi:hypothetical protein
MASLWATGSFSGQSIASSMLVGASLGLACDGTGAASGGVVVDADEVAAACCIVNRFHEERKSAAMASSDLYKSAIFLLESDSSLHESANSVGICGFNILYFHYIVILPELNLNVEVYLWKKQGTIDAKFVLKEIKEIYT